MTPAERVAGVVALAAALAAAGCGGPSAVDDALTVATTWPAPERAEWEKGIHRSKLAPAAIRWVVLAPGDDLGPLATRRDPPDLILGASALACDDLARRGLLEPSARGGGSSWQVARLRQLGYVTAAPTKAPAPVVAPRDLPAGLTFDDPRRDPVTLAWARAVLNAGDWPHGYARLVRAAGARRRPGFEPGAARAAVLRGEAGAAPALVSLGYQYEPKPAGTGFLTMDDGGYHFEGVAALRRGRHAAEAQALLDDLALAVSIAPPDPARTGSPAAAALLADLLGATLVDAGDELRDAWQALEETGHPAKSEMWMTQAPPWPPASVGSILADMPLVETLAAQVAPGADVRAWLLRSWLRPERPIDGALLDELAAAADGRLAREPRLRAWLRGEWTAWARQRYRRVARQARAGQGGL